VTKNWLEWSVFGVSLVVLAGVLAFLAYDALSADGDPPIIDVRLGDVEQQNGAFVIPVTLENLGDEAAGDVNLEVVLLRDGQELETAELAVPFVPRGSTREGWVTFLNDPAQADEIETHVLGYGRP
jgi:uncharacterized protein (TIGR02588 family)